jgi:hypothetical protein
MRQPLVGDLDQLECLACCPGIDGGHRGDRMAVVERCRPGHAIVEQVAMRLVTTGEVRQVRGRDHRLDALQRLGARGVDADDPRMGVRAA